MDFVLIAGLWLDGGQAWTQVAAELERLGHRALPVRLPGQGDGRADATLEQQVEAVLAAVDAAEKPVVVGHSAACGLAWIAADARPEQVDHIVLIGGFPNRDGRADATLEQQVEAVLAAVDAAEKPVVVGHSAACGLAWIAADARPEQVGHVVLIGGFPNRDGQRYAPDFEVLDGAAPFPGWEPFEGPDTADLDEDLRRTIAAAAIPVPQGVVWGVVRLSDERRYAVRTVLVCPEYSPEQAKRWIEAGELPELAKAEHVEYLDIDSGHWPMFTRPAELARMLHESATR